VNVVRLIDAIVCVTDLTEDQLNFIVDALQDQVLEIGEQGLVLVLAEFIADEDQSARVAGSGGGVDFKAVTAASSVVINLLAPFLCLPLTE
jgi:hypothetical protein